MSTTFPTSLQDLDVTRGTSGQPLSSPNHITHHTTEDDTIEALQAKVGVDNSAVTTSLDYKLKSTSSTDPGHKHTTASISVSGLTASQLLRVNSGGTAIESSGKTVPTGAIVGDTDTQTLTNKTISGASNTLTVREADLSTTDVTTANASTSKHGFLKKLSNVATEYIDGTGAWSTPAGNGVPYVASASANLKQSADTERNNRGNSYAGPYKSIRVLYSGTYTVKFDLKSDTGGNTVFGKLYKNGIAVGTERSTSSTSYTTYSEDISVGAGDTIELWTKTTNVATEYAYIQNFRVYYDVAISSNDLVITN